MNFLGGLPCCSWWQLILGNQRKLKCFIWRHYNAVCKQSTEYDGLCRLFLQKRMKVARGGWKEKGNRWVWVQRSYLTLSEYRGVHIKSFLDSKVGKLCFPSFEARNIPNMYTCKNYLKKKTYILRDLKQWMLCFKKVLRYSEVYFTGVFTHNLSLNCT